MIKTYVRCSGPGTGRHTTIFDENCEEKKVMKKWISALLALTLTVAVCAGCGAKEEPPSGIYYDITGIGPKETVMEVDGLQIPAELYFYWLAYSASNTEYQINMLNSYYGLYGELIGEDGQILWDEELEEGVTVSQQVMEDTENSIKFSAAIEHLSKEHGIELTEEDKAAMAENLAASVEQLGSQEAFDENLSRMGLSQESYERISGDTFLFDHLKELVSDPASELYMDPADSSSAYVDHILLPTVDTTTNEPLSEEEIAQNYAKAQELLAQLGLSSGDVEALFTQLAEEYGQDPGRAAENGYLINPDTNFVQEFKDAAFALQPGQISDIVESSYGYHILLRKELTDEQIASVAEEHLTGTVIQERIDNAQVTRSEKLDGIDAGAFYNSYNEKIEALTAADEAANGADSAGQEPAGGTQGTDGAQEPADGGTEPAAE